MLLDQYGVAWGQTCWSVVWWGAVLGLGLVIVGPLVSGEYREMLGWNQTAFREQPLRGSVLDRCWYSATVIAYVIWTDV